MGKKQRTNSHAKRLYETRGQLCILSFTQNTDCYEMTTQALWVELFMKPITKRFGINSFPCVSWLFVAALYHRWTNNEVLVLQILMHTYTKNQPTMTYCIYMAKMKYSPHTLCFTIFCIFWFTWAKLISFKFICLNKIMMLPKLSCFHFHAKGFVVIQTWQKQLLCSPFLKVFRERWYMFCWKSNVILLWCMNL